MHQICWDICIPNHHLYLNQFEKIAFNDFKERNTSDSRIMHVYIGEKEMDVQLIENNDNKNDDTESENNKDGVYINSDCRTYKMIILMVF